MNAEQIVCFVTGSTGWLGRFVLRDLLRRNIGRMFLLVRGNKNLSAERRVRQLVGDCAGDWPIEIVEPRSDGSFTIPAEVSHIVNAAGVTTVINPHMSEKANMGLTWLVMHGAARLPRLRRLIHVSTLLLRGNSRHAFTEDSSDDGQTFLTPYTLSKYLSELIVKKWTPSCPASICRCGSLLMPAFEDCPPNRDWFFNAVRLWLHREIEVLPLSPDQEFHPIPVDMAARAVCDSLLSDDCLPVLHLPPYSGPDIQHVFGVLAASFGIPPPKFRLPWSPEWQQYSSSLSPALRRALNMMFPVPHSGARLSPVMSEKSGAWFRSIGPGLAPVTDEYWTRVGHAIAEVDHFEA